MDRYLKKMRGYIQPPEISEKLDTARHDSEDEEVSYGNNLCKHIPMESGIIQSVIHKIKKYCRSG
jgi:hypothetical protein